MVELVVRIEGMIDQDCAAAVERALGALDGVVVLEVRRGIRTGEATLHYDPRTVSPERIVRAIADEGYRPVLPPPAS